MTDIYFGNGVWNIEEKAIDGEIALRKLMFSRANSRLNRSTEGQEYDFKHAHNPTAGTIDDLIETFYQLKESGQISGGYFMGVYIALAAESNAKAFINKLRDIISKYNSDASTMFSLYQNASFKKKHNVLLVAHSQGNLFGNKMYTLMNEAQKKTFRMVSVATPADHVAGGGPHVTATKDYVIRPIPGSLPSNIAGFGHTFIGTYLNIDGGGALGDGSDNAPEIIANHVKTAYDNLLKSSTCGGEYDQVFMHLYEDLKTMKVYGVPSGTYGTEEIASVALSTYAPAVEVITQYGRIIYVCSKPMHNYGDLDLFKGSHAKGHLTYMPGTMYNKRTVEHRKGLTYTIRGSGGCVDVSFTGDLYDIALSAFDDDDLD